MQKKSIDHVTVIRVLAVLTFVFFASSLQAKQEIIWWDYHWSPLRILEGEFKGEGRADKILSIVRAQLSNYRHKGLKMNFPRFSENAKSKNLICSDSMRKTVEREEYLYYSIPMSLANPVQVIFKAQNIEKFGDLSNLSLEKLLQNSKLKTAVSQGSFGPIDPILQKYKHQKNLSITPFEMSTIAKMMLGDRIDYLIVTNSAVVNFELKKMKTPPQVISSSIIEAKEISLRYFACTKTSEGKKVIDQINQILLKTRPTPEYRQAVLLWYLPSELSRLNQYYDDVFLKTSK